MVDLFLKKLVFKKLFIDFWLHGAFIAAWAFSSRSRWSGPNLWWSTGSRFTGLVVAAHGLSSCGMWAPARAVSVVVAPGLSCSGAFGISLDQDRTHVSCTGRWIPYHWAAREAPKSWFFKNVEKKYYGITAPKPQDTFFISLSQVSGFRRENSPL